MRILHLINDSLFTNFTIDLFEECNPNNNTFLIGVRNVHSPLKYTKKQTNGGVVIAQIRSKKYFDIVNSDVFDVLIIHCLHNFKSVDVSRSDANNKRRIIWLAWGTDLNWIPNHNNNLLFPLTDRIVTKASKKNGRNVIAALTDLYHFIRYGMTIDQSYRKIARMADFCGTVMPQEYIEIREALKEFKAKYVDFSYASLERSFKQLSLTCRLTLGSGILVGNSSSPTSNHVDVFEKIHELGVTNRKILSPLNYGEYDVYVTEICRIGQERFGDDFVPLLGRILSESEYIEFLAGCKTAIFLHQRQQALGNIIILLWLGVKVFLSEINPIYKYFKENGVLIFSYQNELNEKSIDTLLKDEEINNNRMKLMAMYSHEVVVEKAKAMLEECYPIDTA